MHPTPLYVANGPGKRLDPDLPALPARVQLLQHWSQPLRCSVSNVILMFVWVGHRWIRTPRDLVVSG